MASGIYEIINTINGYRYIGSAVDINRRWRNHKSLLNQNQHPNIHLQRAWNKYGAESFQFKIIEQCFAFALINREQYWIDKIKPQYNILPRAGNSLGLKHTDESKAKISKVHTGRKHAPETRLKMSAWQIGKKR